MYETPELDAVFSHRPPEGVIVCESLACPCSEIVCSCLHTSHLFVASLSPWLPCSSLPICVCHFFLARSHTCFSINLATESGQSIYRTVQHSVLAIPRNLFDKFLCSPLPAMQYKQKTVFAKEPERPWHWPRLPCQIVEWIWSPTP